jgi:hypothetical protein
MTCKERFLMSTAVMYVLRSDDGTVEVSTSDRVFMRDVEGNWFEDCLSDKEEHEFDYNVTETEIRQIIIDLLNSNIKLSEKEKTFLKEQISYHNGGHTDENSR